MSKVKWMTGSCFALALALLAWGCAGKAGNTVPFSATTGQHPSDWIPTHYAEYVKTPDQCRTCHGSTSDPAQAGGIAKVSCFTCHTAVNHPTGWDAATQHGRSGAQLAVNADNRVMAGFAHCMRCHGPNFNDGLVVSCMTCHTKAPHPDAARWNKASVVNPSHVNTDVSNAAVCAKCHQAGANSALKPLTTPPAGTAPGCFNETLCHGTNLARP